MRDWWSKQEREDIKRVCNRWIAGNLTVKEIKENIGTLSWAVSVLLPESEKIYTHSSGKVFTIAHASNAVDILIDDILEMDSISDEEKDQSILELVKRNMEELQSLAKIVIAQIEIDTKEYKKQYLKEAEERGYCRKLTEAVVESLK